MQTVCSTGSGVNQLTSSSPSGNSRDKETLIAAFCFCKRSDMTPVSVTNGSNTEVFSALDSQQTRLHSESAWIAAYTSLIDAGGMRLFRPLFPVPGLCSSQDSRDIERQFLAVFDPADILYI